jgi:hypothetical protein
LPEAVIIVMGKSILRRNFNKIKKELKFSRILPKRLIRPEAPGPIEKSKINVTRQDREALLSDKDVKKHTREAL